MGGAQGARHFRVSTNQPLRNQPSSQANLSRCINTRPLPRSSVRENLVYATHLSLANQPTHRQTEPPPTLSTTMLPRCSSTMSRASSASCGKEKREQAHVLSRRKRAHRSASHSLAGKSNAYSPVPHQTPPRHICEDQASMRSSHRFH